MSIRQTAIPNNARLKSPIKSHCRTLRGGILFISILLIFPALLFPPVASFADQTIVAGVTLNQEKKGDIFAIMKDDGDFLVKASDLKKMGVAKLPGKPVRVAGTSYYSLRSLPGVRFKFDEDTLTLKISTAPSLLPKEVVDLMPPRRENVYYPDDNSFFLNYGLDYNLGGNSLSYQGLDLTNEAGLRIDHLLFFTSTTFNDAVGDRRFTRLMSNVTYDRRPRMQRFVAGDFFAASGNLGSSVNLGGLSFSKLYAINPNFIKNPLFDFSGLLALPSQVDLYLNGTRIRSEHFKPGPFELRDLQSFSGAQNLTIVIRDSLGRIHRIVAPFYFTDRLLRKGLSEYSYNLGMLRKDFGSASNHYGSLAYSFFHRVGVSNSLNLGLRGEGGDGLYNLGFESLLKLGADGLLGLQGATSIDRGRGGFASQIGYTYQDRKFSFHLALQNFSDGYQTLGGLLTSRKVQYQAEAGIGYTLPQLGSLSFTFIDSKAYHEKHQPALSVYYARKIWKNLYLNASYRHTETGPPEDEVLFNFNYYLRDNTSFSASVQQNREGHTETLEARKDLPVGEGYAWRATLERAQIGSSSTTTVNPVLQVNGRYGIYRADYSRTEGASAAAGKQNLRLSLSGALVYLGDDMAATRPVTDSFGLVKVGDVKGVRVYANSQTMGRTNAHGEIVVPSLNSFYDNEVSIETKDIPMDYLMPAVRKFVSPPYRSGSCLVFPLQKYQAFTGKLKIRRGNRTIPLADAEVKIPSDKGTIDFYTDASGSFYFDNDPTNNPGLFDHTRELGCSTLNGATAPLLGPGLHPATVTLQGHSFSAQLPISKARGQVTDLGQVTLTIPKPFMPLLPSAAAKARVASATPPPSFPQSGTMPPPKGHKPPRIVASSPAAVPPPTPSSKGKEKTERAVLPWSERKVFFAFDKASLSADTRRSLDAVAKLLSEFSGYQVDIYGYAGPLGTKAYNYRLGLRRADAVKNYLSRRGVAGRKIGAVISYGEERLVCQERRESCYRRNRRVIIKVVKGN